MPRRSFFAESPEFLRLLAGERSPDLARIALEIARDAYPELDPMVYLTRLDALAERVRDRCRDGARLRTILGQINWVLFVEEGVQGNEDAYYDPRNSYLNEVLDRRLGIPISLSVLYLAIADRIGLMMSGVNLPGHFLVRAGQGNGTVFVDPFHGGQFLDRAGCLSRVEEVTGVTPNLDEAALAPCSTATIVARMLRNLKGIHLRESDGLALLPVLRRLAALTGGDPRERRDLGVACVRADRPGEAIDHLQAYLSAWPQADDATPISALLRVARREVARWN